MTRVAEPAAHLEAWQLAKQKKRRGRFCWCCQRVLPNERFSGRGYARHLCRRCSKLGAEEIAYRQEVRNLDRLIDRGGGRIRRQDRAQLERFLNHPNERVRRYAEEVDSQLRREAEAWRAAVRADEEALEAEAGSSDFRRIASSSASPARGQDPDGPIGQSPSRPRRPAPG